MLKNYHPSFMDLGDVFRRFFGLKSPFRDSHRLLDEDDGYSEKDNLDSHRHGRFDEDDVYADKPNEDIGISIFFGNQNGVEDMFAHFHGDMQKQVEALQKQMEEMMKGFGFIDFSSVFQTPKIKAPMDPRTDEKVDGSVTIWPGSVSPFFHSGLDRERKSPRDYMLKADGNNNDRNVSPRQKSPILLVPPDDLPNTKDSDLDGKISEDRLLDIIEKPNLEEQYDSKHTFQKPTFFSSSKSYSFSTFRGPDGRIEEKKVVRDSNGREESTVTKILGDKTYSVTEVIHPDGKQEKRETYNNVDEKDLSHFLNMWKTQAPMDRSLMPSASTELGSNDSDLFFKFFGRKF
ncbi:hypothetical protein Btru_016446 [Bulinus truncatus]|nr:hypothetical protein Btru_016446 [Bulinus truncatus]